MRPPPPHFACAACAETVRRLRGGSAGELEAEGCKVDGVCSFCEVAIPLVARVAEAMGLPGNTPAAVDGARDKHATRAIMAAAVLPCPANVLLPGDMSDADLLEAGAKARPAPPQPPPLTPCTRSEPSRRCAPLCAAFARGVVLHVL